jgi:hypothetical protein
LEIVTADPVVVVSSITVLSARVLDQTGATMSGQVITWSSDDTTTATIDATTGVLSGIAGGEVRIVARSGVLSASVNAVVTYPVGVGQTMVRLRAASESLWNLDDVEGFSHFGDRLGTTEGDYSMLASSEDGSFFDPHTSLAVVVAGLTATGKSNLIAVDPGSVWGLDLGAISGSFLIFEKGVGSGNHVAYVSRGGWMFTENVQLPIGPGERAGLFRGRIMANVTGYSVAWDAGEPQFTPLGDQATLYAEISSTFHHYALPVVSVTLTSGPYAGVMDVSTSSFLTSSSQEGGRLLFGLERDGEEVGELFIGTRRTPSVGSWPISAVDPIGLPEVDYWAIAEFYDQAPFWMSESGELRIDATVSPPASDLTGELRGTFTVNLGGWTFGAASPASTGQHMAATGTYHVPWWSDSMEPPRAAPANRANWLGSRWLGTAASLVRPLRALIR